MGAKKGLRSKYEMLLKDSNQFFQDTIFSQAASAKSYAETDFEPSHQWQRLICPFCKKHAPAVSRIFKAPTSAVLAAMACVLLPPKGCLPSMLVCSARFPKV